MNEKQRKPDRRAERTRRLLHDALMALIVEKGFDAIQIQDITDRADVARPTFYLHFRTKEELLFSGMQEIYDGLMRQPMSGTREEILALLGEVDAVEDQDFRHVAEHADFYRVMLSEKGSLTFLLLLLHYLAAEFEGHIVEKLRAPDTAPRLPADLIASFIAGAQIGVVSWWLKNDLPLSSQDMARAMQFMAAHGINWALDLNAPPVDWRVGRADGANEES